MRIHREGRPSLAATFTVRAKGKPAAPAAGELAPASGREFAYLEFATTETPKEIATLLRRIPSACPKQCPTMSMKAVTAPGQYAHESIGRAQPYPGCAERATPLPHVAHWRPAGSDIPHPMAFSREELRTLVRSVEAPAQRWAINQALFYGETQVDRPDFEYDSNLGPEANFQRRKAWENRDFAGQLGEEAQQRALAQKRMPPLQASIRKYGKAPWNEAETPSAPEGTNLDE